MFVSRLIVIGVALLLLLSVALGAARPSSGAASETRYVVRPGDTLWAIADDRYGSDPREGVWRIAERNHLEGSMVLPGQVLMLPP